VGNKNYGIFPTLSRNGLITSSSASGADDSGIWITTSQNVAATDNLVSGNVVGLEVSNSEDILVANNEARGNSIGVSAIFLVDHFADRPDTRRITIRDNHIHDNNKPNTADPEGILSTVPSGVGIVFSGADDSLVTKNVVENHNLSGIAIADYCLVVAGGDFDCSDPTLPPGFLADNAASNNRVVRNTLRNNGRTPGAGNPFAFAAGDLSLLTLADNGNCFDGNTFTKSFSTLGFLPMCR
jgi:parallel beta-helix repeat protein